MTQATQPRGTVHVVDPSPLNWLYVTYNTVEELVRVTPGGKVRPAAMRWYRWKDERTPGFGDIVVDTHPRKRGSSESRPDLDSNQGPTP